MGMGGKGTTGRHIGDLRDQDLGAPQGEAGETESASRKGPGIGRRTQVREEN